jgi:hypothetical protein
MGDLPHQVGGSVAQHLFGHVISYKACWNKLFHSWTHVDVGKLPNYVNFFCFSLAFSLFNFLLFILVVHDKNKASHVTYPNY